MYVIVTAGLKRQVHILLTNMSRDACVYASLDPLVPDKALAVVFVHEHAVVCIR